MALQSDGKMVVGGYATVAGNRDFGLVRINTDGTLDGTFGTGGKVTTAIGVGNETPWSLVIQSDGKLVLGGYSLSGSFDQLALVRYNTDGTLDTTFDTDGIVTTDIGSGSDRIYGLTLQSDGKLIAVGTSDNGSGDDTVVVRYNTDGSLDTTFDSDGIFVQSVSGSGDGAYSVAISPVTGDIIAAGFSSNGSDNDLTLVAVDGSGQLVSTFGPENTLDGNPTFTSGGAAVVLDADVDVSDTELDALNGGLGNYHGASLTIVRSGGANADDVLSFSDGNGITKFGNSLIRNSIVIATFDTTTTPGQLVIGFTDAFGEIPTTADADTILRQITYSNSNGTPPASVQLDWTFNDGNAGSQGSGGALTATGATTVDIVVTNDAPVITSNGGGATAAVNVTENTTAVTTVTATDADLDTLSYSITGGADAAKFSINSSTGALTFASAPDFETPTDANSDNVYEVTVEVSDGNGGADSQAISVTVTDVDEVPVDLQVTSAGDGGLSINTDGGNDAYLRADDGGAILGGLTSLTVETQFAVATPAANETILLSYAAGISDNEVKLAINPDGRLEFEVGDVSQFTTGSYTGLFDGDRHHVAVSWNGTGGNVVFYVDGAPVESFSGFRTGYSVLGGGVLMFGQEQDSLEGGFETVDLFQGTLYDTRVFNDVRTDGEIADSSQATLPHNEAGMVANWTFSDLSVDGVSTEAVSGNNLTVLHASGVGFSASTPVLTLELDEHSSNGTVVGSVTGTDVEREALIASLLAADADLTYNEETSKFYKLVSTTLTWSDARTGAIGTALNGVSGQLATIRSATENALVTTIAGGGQAWIGGADSSVEGNWHWYSGAAENDQFWTGDSTGSAVNGAYTNFAADQPDDFGGDQDFLHIRADGEWDDSDGTTTKGRYIVEWNADDVLDNAGGSGEQPLTYSIQFQTVAGAFAINSDTGEITVADSSLVDYESNVTHTLTVRVTDVSSNIYDEAFTVALRDANDAPVITSNGGADTAAVNVAENATAVTTVTATDADLPAQTLSYSISGGADAAKFSINNSTGVLTFASAPDFETPTDADTDNVYEVTVQVSDGNGGTDSQALSVTVTAVNDNAPVITSDGGGATAAVNVAENATAVTTVTATDADLPTQTFSYSISGGADAAKFNINSSTGELTFASAPDFESPTDTGGNNVYDVTVQVSDGNGGTDTQDLAVTVTNVSQYTVIVDTTSDVADGTTTNIVSLLNDVGADGKISLREAILATNGTANEEGGPDRIHFAISDALVGGVHTITVSSAGLPGITDAVIIDGATDSDYVAGTPVIELNGAASAGDGLQLLGTSDGSTIRGLIINRFGDAGIRVFNSDNNTIVGNWIGTGADGLSDQGNAGYGIEVDNSGSNQIGGSTLADRNVIAGNGLAGISLSNTGATLNVIQGNYIGVDKTGNAALGNSSDGINVGNGANNNTIGGDRTAGEGNVISGNTGVLSDGVEIDNTGADNNKVYGNYIGTNADGTAAVGNGRYGVVIFNGVQGTEVGGSGTGQGNIISGNTDAGVVINGNNDIATSGNVIQANVIGLNAAGTSAIGNGADGILIFGDPGSTTIGGVGVGNIIAGNTQHGIDITGGSNITIQGNTIGSGTAGTEDLGNTLSGISVTTGVAASNIVIGGYNAGEGNLIAFNHERGIITSGTGTGDQILGNTIHSQDLSGIFSSRSGMLIARNVVYGNSTTATFDEIAIGNNHTVYHNTIHGAAGDGISVEGSNAVIRNNIITGSAGLGIRIDGGSISDESYNLITDAVTGPANLGGQANFTVDATTLNADPLYTNAASGDFSLTEPTSPAINAGVDLGASQPDMNGSDAGLFTGSAPDIGALESAVTNLAPLITSNGGGGAASTNVAENTTAVTTVTSTDVDGGTPSYSISGGADSAKFSINSSTGVLIFVSPPDFEMPTDVGANNVYDVIVTVSDGNGGTDTQAIAVTIDDVNDNPLVTNLDGDTLNYTEGDGAVVIEQGDDAVVSDVDSVDFDSGSLSVEVDSGLQAGEDVFSVRNQGTGGGQIGVSGGDVTYSGTVIGTLAGGTGLTPLTVTFNANATPTAVTALVRNLTYQNSSADNPTPGARSVTIDITDGDGGTALTQNTSINVSAVNDAPVADLNGSDGGGINFSTTFAEGDSPVAIADTDATITDPDHATYQGLGINLGGFVDGASELIRVNGEQFVFGVSRVTTTSVGGTLFDVDFDGSGFTITENGGGTIPQADIQALVRTVTYENTSQNPTTGNRTFNVIPQDAGSLNASPAAVSTVAVSAVNDDPTNDGSLPTDVVVTEDVSTLIDFPDIDYADVDHNNQLVLLTFQTSTGGKLFAGSDVDVIVSGSGTGILQLQGGVADINTFMNSPRISYLHGTPHTNGDNADTIQVTANDLGNTGSGGSGTVVFGTVNVDITAVNDNPVLAIPAGTTAFTEGTPKVIAPSVTLTDPDGLDFDGGQLTVSIASGGEATDDIYILTTSTVLASGANLSYDFGSGFVLIGSIAGGNGVGDPLVVTFNSNSTAAAIHDVAELVFFQTLTDTPSETSRVIEFDLTDGDGGSSTTQSRTVSVTAVNDAPVNSVPGAQATAFETDLVFSTGNGNLISISDVDAGSNEVAVTLTATNGTVTVQPTQSVTSASIVNTFTTDSQTQPDIAVAADGSYAIVWQSLQQDGTNGSIYAQWFNSNGTTLGSETKVSQPATGTQNAPSIAVSGSGDYVVTWQSSGQDGSGTAVVARRYDASGNALGNEFVVNTTTSGNQSQPDVAVDSSGGFVIVWSGEGPGDTGGVFYRRYDNTGTALDGAEVLVNTVTANGQMQVAVDLDSSGNYVITWDSAQQDGTDRGIYARRYQSNGTAIDGSEFRVSNLGTNFSQRPDISVNDSGDFIIVWQNQDDNSIRAQRYSSNGSTNGSIIQVSDATLNAPLSARVSLNNSGESFVSWTLLDTQATFLSDAYGRRIDASGTVIGPEVKIVATADDEGGPVSHLADDGTLHVVWYQQVGAPSDVYHEKYDALGVTFTAGDGVNDATLTMTGTVSDLNTLLDGLVFTPTTSFTGTATLQIQTNDQGNTGSGGSKTDDDTVIITVGSNNAPSITSNGGGATAAVNVAENSTAVTTVTSTDSDGGTPVYSITGGADAAKFAINSSTGVLTFASAPDFETPTDVGGDNVYEVTVQVSDGNGGTDSQDISVTVTAVNETPGVTTGGGIVINEDTSGTMTLSVSDVDLNGGELEVTLSVGKGAFSLASTTGLSFSTGDGTDDVSMVFTGQIADVNAALATITYSPDSHYVGADSLSYTVSDQGNTGSGGAKSISAALGITVNAVADAPIITSNGGGATAAISVADGSSIVTDVIATDADGDAVTYSISGGADVAKFGIDSSTGALTFLSAPDFNAPTDADMDNVYEVTVEATDGSLTDSQAISVTVTEFNSAPVLDNTKSPALAAIAEDAGAPSGAVGTLVSGLVDFATPAGQVDNVTDADGGALGIAVISADTTNGAWFYSTDNGSNWSALGTVSGSNARLLAADASTRLYFQPNANYHGSLASAITFHAWDQTSGTNGGTTDFTHTFTVLDQFATASYSNNDGTASWSSGWVETNDDGSATTGDVRITSGQLRLDNLAGGALPSITRQVDLSSASSATLSFDFNGYSTGQPERFKAWVSDNGGSTWVELEHFTPAATGVFSGSRSYDLGSVVSLTSNVVIRFSLEQGFGNPADPNYVNFDNVGISYEQPGVTGGTSAFSTATDTASLTVNPVADTPSVTNATTNEETQTTSGLVISRNAADGTEVTHFKITNITSGTLYRNDGMTVITDGSFITFAEGNAGLKFTPDTDFNGTATFDIQASQSGDDSGLGGSTTTASITVNGVNDAPVITSNGGGATAAINVAENATAVTTVSSTDVDGGAPSYSISGGADGAKFNINSSTGALTFASAPDFESPTDTDTDNVYEVTVEVTDGSLSDSQAISVTVTPVIDNAPAITSNGGGATAAVNVAENTTAVTTVTASDADLPGDTLTYSIGGGADAAKFSINSSTGALAFASAPNFEAPADVDTDNVYEVTVQVSDGSLTDTQAISVTVTPVIDNAPAITSNGGGATAAVNVAENTTAVTTVTASDADLPGDTLTYSISGGADGAKFSINSSTGELTFASAPDFESPTDADTDNVYEVTVQVSDGSVSDTQAISVTVTPVIDNAPSITSDGGGATVAVNVAENTTAVTTVTASDADLPGDTLTYSISGGADAAKFSINGLTGELTFANAPDFETPTDANTDNVYEVTVQVSDGSLTDTQAISVTVTPVIDNAPAITSNGGGATAAVNAAENTTAVTTVTAIDTDLPGDTLTYSIGGGADAAKFSINGSTGELTFATAPDFETPTDANTDNVYEVTVQVSDGSLSDSQDISVTVANVSQYTLIVDTTSDVSDGTTTSILALLANKGADGKISLREAILAANATVNEDAGVDRIHFEIADALIGGAHTIQVGLSDGTGLPQITDTVIIDGTTDADFGSTPIIELDGSNVMDGSGGLVLAAGSDGSTIRGLVINSFSGAGSDDDGFRILTDNNLIVGNYIGTDVAGTTAVANGADGIQLDSGASGNTIGGTTGADRNVISGNAEVGIALTNSSTGNLIQGNYIGVASDGTTLLGNGIIGIRVTNGAQATIGGTAAGAGNIVAGAGSNAGIRVNSSTSVGTSILGNAVYSNNGLGIDLETSGVDANDAGDVDSGANNLQNYPVLTSATTDGSSTLTVAGTINTTASTTYRIEFFSSTVADPTAHGEAERYLGAVSVTTDGSGNATFSKALSVSVADAEFITATATVDLGGGNYGDTSEFAQNIEAEQNTAAPVITSDGGGPTAAVNVAENATAVTTVTATDSDLPSQTLSYSISGGADAAKFSINSSTGVLAFASAPDFESPTDADTDNVYEVTVQVSDGAGGTDSQVLAVTVTAVNEQPAFTGLDGNPTFVEGGSAVVIDADVQVFDPELSGLDDFNGATLGIVRNGGAAADDVFTFTGNLSSLGEGQPLILSAVTIGTVTTNSGGTLLITFNGNATQARANEAMQSIAYANFHDNPLASVQLDWTFSDGNSGSQGSGGTLTATGSTTVNITATNDDPSNAGSLPASVTVTEDIISTIDLSAINLADPDANSGTLTVTLATSTGGNIFAASGTGITRVGSGTSTLTLTGTLTDLNTYLDDAGNLNYLHGTTHTDGTGADTIQVDVTDNGNTGSGGGGTVSLGSVSVDISGVNDTPSVTTGGGLSIPEDSSGTMWLSVSDVDLNGGDMLVTLSVSNGTFSLAATTGLSFTVGNGTGDAAMTFTGQISAVNTALATITYTPGQDFVGSDTLSYSFNDQGNSGSGGAKSFNAGLGITVTAVNDAPTITSNGGGATAATNVAENTTAVTTVTSTDVDGGTASYSISGGADSAKFAINSSTGELTFTSAPDFESPTDTDTDNFYEVTVQVSDGAGGTDTQAISVTVTPVIDNAPSITSDGGGATSAINVAENSTAVTTVTATDADLPAQTLSYSITGGADATKFSINSSTGELTFTSAPDFESPTDADTDNIYEVIVQVSDGSLTDTQAISVTVTPVIDNAPVITSDGGGASAAVNVAENTTAVTTVTASDADLPGDTLTYSISGGADAAKFNINSSTGELTFASAPDFETPTDADTDNVYEVTVQVSDGSLSDTQAISVTVTPVIDNAPAITSNGGGATAAVDVAENTTAVTTVTASDSDQPGDTLTYSISGGADAAKFNINSSTGELTFASAPDFETPTDADTDNVYEVTVQVSDGSLTDTQAISVTVTPVIDNAPAITSNGGGATAAVNVAENTTAVTTVTASDADQPGDTLTYSISGGADAAKFNINSSSGELTFASAPDFESPADAGTDNVYEVSVQVSDGSLTDTQAISVTVTPVIDNAPSITSDGGGATAAVNVAENTIAVTTVTASDADLPGDTLTYSISGGADAAKFNINSASGELTFASAPDFETPTDADTDNVYDVTVQVSDGSLSDTQAISVTVTPVIDNAPAITSNGGGATAAVNVAENTTAVTTVTASDADLPGDTLTYSISGGADAAKFSINSSSGELTFASAPDFEMPTDADTNNVYEVTVQVSDGSLTDTQAISVTVTSVNDNAPVITSEGGGATAAVNVAENATAVTTVTATDADLPTQTLSYSISGGADAAKFGINSSTGELTFASAPDYETPTDADTNNVYEVTVQVSDGSLTDTQAISVTVTPVIDNAPVITSNGGGATAAVNVAENTTAVTTVTATDADLPGDTLTYSISGGADAAKFNINGSSGLLTFASAPDFETPTDADTDNIYEVTVQVSDGSLTDTQAISVTVTPVIDNAPLITSNGGGATAAVDVAENTTAVTTVTASDADLPGDMLTYTISGGADAAKFNINSSTGALTFASAPDFETPTDADTDNVYEVTVEVSDELGMTDSQAIFVTVIDVDEFDVSAVTDSDAADNAVAENATVGTTVGLTASASDDDATTNAITYSLDDDAGGLFAINSSTGVVTVNAALDYETATSHNVSVRATSADTSFSTQSFSMSVTDVNESGVSTISDSDATADFVLENSANGTSVGITAFADDADGTDSVSYSLDDNAGGRFAINSSTGEVTVAGATDRESAGSYGITVRATSTDTSFTTKAFTITIGDVDEFDVSSPTDTDGTADAVNENAANGTTVGITASASDADATTNGITYSLFDNAGGRFAINSSTGIVTVADGTQLDREAAASHNITVRATSDDGSTSDTTFTISLNDLDEFDVGSVTDSDAADNTVAENATVGTTVGLTASASDADATTNAITYSLDDDAGGLFAINSSKGIVTVNAALDYETATSHNVTVRATSADGSFSTKDFTITVNDLDEFDITAINDADATLDNVDENATVGTTVGITAFASDADATTNGITYSLDDDSAGQFAIDGSSGEVTVAGAIDRETGATRSITVRATSEDGSSSTKSFTIAINDLDEFDITAISDSDGGVDTVNENAAVGVSVGIRASASDADSTTNTITYSLDDDSNGEFFIEAAAGDVKVAGPIDREAGATRTITVRATSADGSFSTKDFTIAINDLNDNAPVIDLGQSFDVSEFASNGDSLGTATATDADTVGTIQNWAITGGNVDNIFEIDSASGELRVADNSLLNFETTATYILSLRVEDGANTSSIRTVTVNVGDENDVPILDVNAGISVVEGSAVIISSAELSVSDEDELANEIQYTIVNAPTAGRLERTSNPGVSISTFTQADIDNNLVRFVHDGSEADDSFTFSISDGSGGTIGTTLFSITNLRVNDAPVNAVPISQTTAEDTPLVFSSAGGNSITVSDVDLNGGMIGVQLVATNGVLTLGSTTGLTFAAGDGTSDSSMVFAGTIGDVNAALDGLTFDQTADYNGPATVRLVSRDMGSSGSGGEQIDDDTIDITVVPVNDAPVAIDDDFSIDEDNTLTVSSASGLLSNDSDIDLDVLNVVPVTGVANGTLSLNADGSFVYTPNTNFNGVDSFTYRATDGSLESETRTVTLNVAAVNDASVSVDDQFVIDQLTVLELSAANGVLINDLDVESDALQAVLVEGPQNGRLVLNADGSLTYTPNATFFGEDVFTYRSLDGTDDGSIATVRITVRQTVTSGGGGTDGGDGDGTSNGDGDGSSTGDVNTDQTGETGTDEGPTGDGTTGDGTVDGSDSSAPDDLLTSLPTDTSTTESEDAADETRETSSETNDSQNDGSQLDSSSYVVALRIDDRGELRDRLSGRIVEDAGVVVFTSTDVGSMVYVLEQTGFWTELDTFEQDVQNAIQNEGEWEELVVETTTVAGTTLTVGYIVWLLRSGSVVFGLVSSLPAWTMMDPLPVLQSGLETLGNTDDSDDDSLQGILQAHHDNLNDGEASFEGS